LRLLRIGLTSDYELEWWRILSNGLASEYWLECTLKLKPSIDISSRAWNFAVIFRKLVPYPTNSRFLAFDCCSSSIPFVRELEALGLAIYVAVGVGFGDKDQMMNNSMVG